MIFKNNQKGFSLLELLLVLGIIAALIVSAFIIYPKVQLAQKTDQDLRDITTITNGIKELYSGKAILELITVQAVINSKIAPDYMVKGNKLYLTNSKEITISENHSNTSGYLYNYFVLMMSNFPDDECARIAPMIFKNAFILKINSQQVSRDASSPTEFNVADAISYCNGGKNGNSVAIFLY